MRETVHLSTELDTADYRAVKILAATRGVTLRKLLTEMIRREAEAEAAKPKEPPKR